MTTGKNRRPVMMSVEMAPAKRKRGRRKANAGPHALYMREWLRRKAAGEVMKPGPRLIDNPSKNTLRMRAYRAKKRAEAEAKATGKASKPAKRRHRAA
jgi:hypothetical protein